MKAVKKTAKQAYADFAKYIGKGKAPNAWCPANVAGCALGYGYFVGYPSKIWNVSVWIGIAKKEGTYRTSKPVYGDAVFFDWSGAKKHGDHIGFFLKEDKNYVWTISANSGASGIVREVKQSKKFVLGYGTVVKFKAETAKVPVKPVVISAPVEEPLVEIHDGPVVNVSPVVPANPKPKSKYVTVHSGDSYWSIARRELTVPNTPKYYARIAAKSAKIQVLNKKKKLVAGKTVRVN